MRASLEIFAFLHSKTAIYFFQYMLLVLQILCRYKWHACRLTCTDKFSNVATKLWKSIIGGGGGVSGYANGWQCQGSRYNDLGNLRAKRAANLKILVCIVVFLCWIKRFVLLSLCLNVNIIWIDIFQAFKNRGGTIPPQKNSRGGGDTSPPSPQDRRLWYLHHSVRQNECGFLLDGEQTGKTGQNVCAPPPPPQLIWSRTPMTLLNGI